MVFFLKKGKAPTSLPRSCQVPTFQEVFLAAIAHPYPPSLPLHPILQGAFPPYLWVSEIHHQAQAQPPYTYCFWSEPQHPPAEQAENKVAIAIIQKISLKASKDGAEVSTKVLLQHQSCALFALAIRQKWGKVELLDGRQTNKTAIGHMETSISGCLM